MKKRKGWQHFPLPPLYPLYPYVVPTDKAVAEKPVRFTIEQRGNCTVFWLPGKLMTKSLAMN